MRIQHNISAMNAYRNYTGNNSALSKNLEKLSSGYKINRAGDDAAGLAISEKMRAQIAGLDQAQSNAKSGVNLVQTAEGALTEVHDMLNRMTTLANQSANGTFDDETDRANLQKEVDQLKSEINRIADSANFNGIKLLNGDLSGASQIKGKVTVEMTTAVKAKYETAALAEPAGTNKDLSDLTTKDIGKTIDYNVTWEDEGGTTQTTTVTLTFQGDGNGKVDTTNKNKNYFTDADGKQYALKNDGTLELATLTGAIQKQLNKDEKFSSSFATSYDGTNKTLSFEAKVEGTAGAKIKGISLQTSLTGKTAADVASANIESTPTEKVVGVDSMQKIDITALKVANQQDDTTDKVNEKIFELDGHKFLLVDGSATTGQNATGFTDEQLKKVGDDVTVIKLAAASASTPTAADAEHIATEIGRVTGLDTKSFAATDVAAGAKYDTTKTGLTATDIVFTKDVLKTSGNELTLQIGDTSDDFNQLNVKIQDMHTSSLGIADIDIGKKEGAQDAVAKIKDAINNVSNVRGTLGATQNRLEHTMNNLSVMSENITDAESTIRDTDVAAEMMKYTKNNILIQSAQAMLAQANQTPQGVLQLLQ